MDWMRRVLGFTNYCRKSSGVGLALDAMPAGSFGIRGYLFVAAPIKARRSRLEYQFEPRLNGRGYMLDAATCWTRLHVGRGYMRAFVFSRPEQRRFAVWAI